MKDEESRKLENKRCLLPRSENPVMIVGGKSEFKRKKSGRRCLGWKLR